MHGTGTRVHAISGPPRAVPGHPGAILGPSWARAKNTLSILGAPTTGSGLSLGQPGAIFSNCILNLLGMVLMSRLGHLGAILGRPSWPSWALPGPSWTPLPVGVPTRLVAP